MVNKLGNVRGQRVGAGQDLSKLLEMKGSFGLRIQFPGVA